MYDSYLSHHGILGMKWGVRRYQNADGSLTEEGKKRYYNSDGTPTKAGRDYENKQVKKDRKEADKYRALLSDEELNSRINRLQRENQLHDLTRQNISRGQKVGQEILENTGRNGVNQLLVNGALMGVGLVGSAYIKKNLGAAVGVKLKNN